MCNPGHQGAEGVDGEDNYSDARAGLDVALDEATEVFGRWSRGEAPLGEWLDAAARLLLAAARERVFSPEDDHDDEPGNNVALRMLEIARGLPAGG